MKALVVMGVCGLLMGIEVLAYVSGGVWKDWGFVVWVITGLVSVLATVVMVVRMFIRDVRVGELLAWSMMLTVGVVAVLVNSQIFYINHESTQQLIAAFRSVEQPGFNYTGTAFLGYPVRQYFLAAFPSWLLGRSPLAIGLGYNWLFLLGMGMWYVGLRSIWNGKKGIVISSLLLVGLLVSPYVLMYLRLYEQSILPVSLTMVSLGWFMYWWKQKSYMASVCMVWFGCLLGTSYTPALASWGLLLSGLLLVAMYVGYLRNWKFFGVTIAMLVTVAVFGGLSFTTRTDIFKSDRMERTGLVVDQQLALVVQGYKAYFGFNSAHFWPWMFGFVVIGVLGWCMVGKRGVMGTVAAGWVVGVIGLSVYLAGYADPNPTFSLHRALITMPVLLTLLGGILHAHLSDRWVVALEYGGGLMAVVIVGVFVYQARIGTPYGYNEPVMSLVQDMVETLAEKHTPVQTPVEVLVVHSKSELVGIEFILPYYYDQTRVYYDQEQCQEAKNVGIRLVYTDNPSCLPKTDGVAGATSFSYWASERLETLTKLVEE